ncbi:hypothetical protein [Amycolatopsis regifaucium]|uniref:Uncharacterized protein n=1 Tax=Amycolatopsis regifaucium TaxID=546365 RepID=A0A154MSB3_9PSEU|nr:hypothetical protein [Amycolatopsis regifaucium]KZB87145.1 hypothetical protein AVL48_20945 [Amycolatopsis regifaucium]OKA07976.1 hypothetical protein ATP06_0211710 [Amycolatopsis regifaucium]SFI35113.1 hypothetical protein SAMN04489731_1102 [Amycolatopsis regifaucium]
MTATLEPTRYIVIPQDVWERKDAPPPPPDDEFEPYSEDDAEYLAREPEPLSLGAYTGLGGATGSLAFGIAAGVLVASPMGLVVGVAAGVFGGLMGHSLAEEIYERKH